MDQNIGSAIIADRSITKDEFEAKYKPMINAIGDIIMSTPEKTEDTGFTLTDMLSGLKVIAAELQSDLENRVPEIKRVTDELAKVKNQNIILQQTNHDLFLKVGTQPNPAAADPADAAPKILPWDEIKKVIEAV